MNRNVVMSALLSLFIFSACGVSTKTLANGNTTSNAVMQAPVVLAVQNNNNAKITVKKSDVIGVDFYYGIDLQQTVSTTSLQRIGVFFRVEGEELHLVIGDHATTIIDELHPESLVSSFFIINETSDSYVLSEANSASYISSVVSPGGASLSNHWVHSYEYVQSGNTFFQESVIELSNHYKMNVIESIIPRIQAPNPTLIPSHS